MNEATAARSKRDQLVETALALFHRDGFHATGIDRILAEAGCAKMTLYNHFRSKEELILAALRRRDRDFCAWFVTEVERRAQAARDRLLVTFDVLGEWFRSPTFYGCLFINAAAEFCEHQHAVHQVAREHKARVHAYLAGLAATAGATDPDGLGRQIQILQDGAIVAAQVSGDPSVAVDARRMAELLINAALI